MAPYSAGLAGGALGTGPKGIDVKATMAYHKELTKAGQTREAGMLMTIMCGGLWGEDRRHKAGYCTDNVCQACNSAPGTDWHRCWGCRYYNGLDEEVIKESN